MFSIAFLVGGVPVRVTAEAGERVLEAARRANVALDAPCGGNGSCGKCRVRLVSGAVDSPRTRHISASDWDAGWRLACECRVASDAVFEVPDSASAYRRGLRVSGLSTAGELERFERTRSALSGAGLAFGAGLCAVPVRMDAPTLEDTLPDSERVAWAVEAATGASRVAFGLRALQSLARVLRAHGFQARCVLERRGDSVTVLDVLPPEDVSPVAGIAVDLGTTSVSALLVDMETGSVLSQASAGNAQIRYGADVISRIIEASKDGGSERLQRAVIAETLVPLIAALCKSAGIAPERVYRMSVAGNTTMNHLLLGLYAEPVRMEPYIPTFFQTEGVRANDLGLGLHPDAQMWVAPNIGSYVGGDITAGCLASMLWREDALTLFVDLGTNGELVFGNREFLMSCACSAGPAFEGGDITCGMRATEGAIDRVTIDAETLEPAYTTIGGGAALGLCGSGLIDLIAGLFRAKAIDGRGKFIREGRRIVRDADGMGAYVAVFDGDGYKVYLTEADIDSFIRAKGAIFSATMTMLDALGMTPDMIERVCVAGGIGSGIDMDNAVSIGMLPDIERGRFEYIGNSALTGAYAMLTSDACRAQVGEIARGMTYLELSSAAGYMEHFVAACFLPHTDGRLFPSVGGTEKRN